jgi:hypothetical protein
MPDGLQLVTNVDLSGYDLAVRRMVTDLGIWGPEAVKIAGRQLFQELIKITAPKTQAQGRKAVARDISKAMWALDPKKIHNRILRQAVEDREYDVVAAFLASIRNKGGLLSNYHLEHFSPHLHQSKRDKRGRVRRSQRVIVLERSEHSRYVREIQGHVGSAKYAWGKGASFLGATVPGWILNHHASLGELENGLHNVQNPSVAMTNKSPGVATVEASMIQRAVNRRELAMNRDVDQVLAGRASRYFD